MLSRSRIRPANVVRQKRRAATNCVIWSSDKPCRFCTGERYINACMSTTR